MKFIKVEVYQYESEIKNNRGVSVFSIFTCTFKIEQIRTNKLNTNR